MNNPAGFPVPAFVLRSGETVPFRRGGHEAMDGLLDELMTAIVRDALQRGQTQPDPQSLLNTVGNEILAEVTHLADTMPAVIAQGLLIKLLYDEVFARLEADMTEYQRQRTTN